MDKMVAGRKPKKPEKDFQPQDAWVPLGELQVDAYLRGGSAAVDWRDVVEDSGDSSFNPDDELENVVSA